MRKMEEIESKATGDISEFGCLFLKAAFLKAVPDSERSPALLVQIVEEVGERPARSCVLLGLQRPALHRAENFGHERHEEVDGDEEDEDDVEGEDDRAQNRLDTELCESELPFICLQERTLINVSVSITLFVCTFTI